MGQTRSLNIECTFFSNPQTNPPREYYNSPPPILQMRKTEAQRGRTPARVPTAKRRGLKPGLCDSQACALTPPPGCLPRSPLGIHTPLDQYDSSCVFRVYHVPGLVLSLSHEHPVRSSQHPVWKVSCSHPIIEKPRIREVV